MQNNIIEQLKDDSNYYGSLGKQYLSNSDIYSLLKNPRNFRKSEKSLPLIEGGYFHTAMLEPEKIDSYKVMDVSSRATKAFKEYINDNELDPYDVLLTKEVDKVNTWVDAMKSNFEMYTDISRLQVISISGSGVQMIIIMTVKHTYTNNCLVSL